MSVPQRKSDEESLLQNAVILQLKVKQMKELSNPRYKSQRRRELKMKVTTSSFHWYFANHSCAGQSVSPEALDHLSTSSTNNGIFPTEFS